MNKKLIAIAVASVMAAPIAMADVKMSGRVNAQYGIKSVDGATDDPMGRLNDSGQARFQVDVTSGKVYARWAIDNRYGRASHTHSTVVTDAEAADVALGNGATFDTDKANTFGATNRDSFVGYKFDGFKLQYGRMGVAGKNIEKDPYIATFLQIRGASEAVTKGTYGSSSFVDDVVQLSTKVGGGKLTAQINFDDKSSSISSTNEGMVALSYAGKAGAVNYWVAYNTGSTDGANGSDPTNDDTNIKVGASMKFGKIKGTFNYTSADANGAGKDNILLMADMGLGNGMSVNGTIGLASADGGSAGDTTFLRLAFKKKLAKGVSAYAGYTSTDYDAANTAKDFSVVGAGMTVKF